VNNGRMLLFIANSFAKGVGGIFSSIVENIVKTLLFNKKRASGGGSHQFLFFY
jgi:hypothetical protein